MLSPARSLLLNLPTFVITSYVVNSPIASLVVGVCWDIEQRLLCVLSIFCTPSAVVGLAHTFQLCEALFLDQEKIRLKDHQCQYHVVSHYHRIQSRIMYFRRLFRSLNWRLFEFDSTKLLTRNSIQTPHISKVIFNYI